MKANTETFPKKKKSEAELNKDYKEVHEAIERFMDKHQKVVSGVRTIITRNRGYTTEIKIILDMEERLATYE